MQRLIRIYMKALQTLVASCLLLTISCSIAAQEAVNQEKESDVATEKYEFESNAQRALFLELSQELRCPKCQNQNIADSNAMIAEDMKRKVHQLVQQGSDKNQVINFMKQRYGEFVHYNPPVNQITIWLYLIPAFFVLLAAVVIASKKKTTVNKEIDEATLQRAEQALKDNE